MVEITPNLFAYASLLLWPLVALTLFAKLPPGQALIWTILGAHLLLPVGTAIKFPAVPALDKETIPNLVALVGCLTLARRFPPVRNRFGLTEIVLAAMLIGPFITSEYNGDAIVIGDGVAILPGVGQYDALSASVSQLLTLLPFLLGRRFLRTPRDNLDILRILSIAGLVYTLPMLLEIRMSPQLHTWIYGYFPHSFEQQFRDGGYRPVVFLGHGLLVAFFAATTVLASVALWKTDTRIFQLPPAGVTAWLGGALLLCKSLGSLLYAFVMAPLILLASPRAQIRLAVVLASISLTYPMLRTTNLVPVDFLLNAASSVSAAREASLQVRFEQEKALLTHASERIWFGWGRYGRGRVYDEYGKDISITDGRWIITLSTFGLFGFLAEFGLMALSVFRAARAWRYTTSARERVYLATLAIIVAVGLLDLLPNASISPWSWLLAGSLLGRCEALYAATRRRPAASASSGSTSLAAPPRITNASP